MVLGEGAWIYVLEEFEQAQKRGAKIYAEIAGYGSTCDAHHRVRLEETGYEPARAMSLALEDAGLEPGDVDYINLHGTSTVLNDRIETSALKLAFNSQAARIPMSATKSQIGHPQGACGAAGVAATRDNAGSHAGPGRPDPALAGTVAVQHDVQREQPCGRVKLPDCVAPPYRAVTLGCHQQHHVLARQVAEPVELRGGQPEPLHVRGEAG